MPVITIIYFAKIDIMSLHCKGFYTFFCPSFLYFSFPHRFSLQLN
ncbi:hypothetical protein HMPREF9420_2752 [Segatella salivae DSM 15606]|uniref:Uncharacterized protein n=1 Tax=Segatella salivae DSM 15606 TaxID=888832 RepID=E6MTD4_9BACT|nr:hypothetical protein HMPREF9420_2752 [Segatella salivae DSM 15606]